MPIGPSLPPHLQSSVQNESSEDEDIGPSLPSHMKKSDGQKSIGPTLPPSIQNNEEICLSSDEENIGPKLPSSGPSRPKAPVIGAKRPSTGVTASNGSPKRAKSDDSDEDFGPSLPGPAQKGPQLPAHFREMLAKQNPLYDENVDLEKYSRPIEEIMAEETARDLGDTEVVGPVLPGEDIDEEELERQRIIARSEKMKAKLEGKDEKPLEREAWMTELPDFRTGNKLQVTAATQFRKNGILGKDEGRDEWTKTPNSGGKLTTKEKRDQEKSKIQNLAEWERNHIQMEKMKKLKTNKESLLESHQKKQEKEQSKETGPKYRVAFDHKRDMQGSIIDDAKRKAMLKKTMGLENKFSSGNSKFL